ncbi:MAG: hypothetical protein ACOYMN_21855, partial [Roseimicrobium sp.]
MKTNNITPSWYSTFRTLLLACALTTSGLNRAHAVDLNFSTPLTPITGNYLFGDYISDLSVDFKSVATIGATTVDMRVTASTWGDVQFLGHYPDYSNNLGQPDGDLGVYYHATGAGLGGIHYQMDFYLGGSNFTTPFKVSQLDLMLYDVDGEGVQSEALKAYTADGLVSYQTGTDASSVTATPITGGVLFTG